MHTAVRLAVNNDRNQPRKLSLSDIRKALKGHGMRFKERSLTGLVREDLDHVVYIPRKEGAIMVIPVERSMAISGLRRREVPIRFTTLKAAGVTLDFLFTHRMLDAFVVHYCGEEVAVVVSANQLVEYLR